MSSEVMIKPTIARAMMIMVAAMLFVPGLDAIAKYLALNHGISPASTTFFRFLIQSVLLFMAIIGLSRAGSFSGAKLGVNLLRGTLMGLASMLFFVSVKYMPLADCIAVFFVEPLLLMMLSSIFLGETVGWRRRIAAIVGLCGALIVIQPSYALFGPISLLPLLVALLFSVYLILTRKFSAEDEPVAMQFYAGLGGVLICSLILSAGSTIGAGDFSFTLPEDNTAIYLLLLLGLLATVSHMLIVVAFSMAPASILAPFQYVEIVSATLLGFFIFADFPSLIKWVGIAIIVGSGLYTFVREQQIERETLPR